MELIPHTSPCHVYVDEYQTTAPYIQKSVSHISLYLIHNEKLYNLWFLKIETMHLLCGQIFLLTWKCDVRKTHFHARQVIRFGIISITNILKFCLKRKFTLLYFFTYAVLLKSEVLLIIFWKLPCRNFHTFFLFICLKTCLCFWFSSCLSKFFNIMSVDESSSELLHIGSAAFPSVRRIYIFLLFYYVLH